MNRCKLLSCHARPWESLPWEEALERLGGLHCPAIEGFDSIYEQFREKVELAQDRLRKEKLQWIALSARGNLANPENHGAILKDAMLRTEFLHRMGASFLIMETGPREIFQSVRQDFQIVINLLNELAKRCSDYDIQFCVQPRVGDRMQTEDEIDRILTGVDTRDVTLCPDTGHLYRAELDPVHILKIYGSCIRHIHLSDIPKPAEPGERVGRDAERIFCPPGEGLLDFQRILHELYTLNYEGWITFTFDPGERDPEDDVKTAWNFLDTLSQDMTTERG